MYVWRSNSWKPPLWVVYDCFHAYFVFYIFADFTCINPVHPKTFLKIEPNLLFFFFSDLLNWWSFVEDEELSFLLLPDLVLSVVFVLETWLWWWWWWCAFLCPEEDEVEDGLGDSPADFVFLIGCEVNFMFGSSLSHFSAVLIWGVEAVSWL